MTIRDNKSASLTAQSTFTGTLVCANKDRVSVSISDVSDSTVTLQRRLDGSNWRDVDSWTADVETTYVADEGCEIQLGIKTGDYGSDTVAVRIGMG